MNTCESLSVPLPTSLCGLYDEFDAGRCAFCLRLDCHCVSTGIVSGSLPEFFRMTVTRLICDGRLTEERGKDILQSFRTKKRRRKAINRRHGSRDRGTTLSLPPTENSAKASVLVDISTTATTTHSFY